MAPVGVVGEVYGDIGSGGGGGLGGGESILRLRVLWATGVGDGQLVAARTVSNFLRMRQYSGLRLENGWRMR